MGRSAASCLKLLTCGSDSADDDEHGAAENKGSIDKRGWSFRKRSAQHRVLSNTAIPDTPFAENKETAESVGINFQPQAISTVPEKSLTQQLTDEKVKLPPTVIDSKVSETIIVEDNENKDDLNLERSILVIQAVARGFLARRALLKLKKVVKLQSAVRGYLTRRRAVGTLRCVQAIVKMQALVRARHSRICYMEEKFSGDQVEEIRSNALCLEISETKSTVTYTSIRKLLSNKFAQQLLESTPKTKPTQIKCDSSNPNSAWTWLQRWTSVSSSDPSETPKPELGTEDRESVGNLIPVSRAKAETPVELVCEPTHVKHSSEMNVVPSENEEKQVADDAKELNFLTPMGDNLEQPQPERTDSSSVKGITLEINSLPSQPMLPDSISVSSHPCKLEAEIEPNYSTKRYATEPLETDGKKSVLGTRKTSNPAFIAVHSKFEELSSVNHSGISINSFHRDVGVEINTDTVLSGADTVLSAKELNSVENFTLDSSRVHVGGSECGTELSITSTLDSPDRSEVGVTECEHESKMLEDACDLNGMKTLDVIADASAVPESNLSQSVSNQPEKLEKISAKPVDLVDAVDSQHKEQMEKCASDLQVKHDSETGHAYGTSPRTSPRSYITLPESQVTPSSQVSISTKGEKAGKSGSNKKQKPTKSKKLHPNPNLDFVGNSTEKMPTDMKNEKKRNLFGSPSSGNIDQEPRDSSSNFPHFMQATESARAKLNANNSPRSSPNIDKDIQIKKRHSLPGANGRQGSPHVRQSTSQAPQNAKGDGALSHERKWQR